MRAASSCTRMWSCCRRCCAGSSMVRRAPTGASLSIPCGWVRSGALSWRGCRSWTRARCGSKATALGLRRSPSQTWCPSDRAELDRRSCSTCHPTNQRARAAPAAARPPRQPTWQRTGWICWSWVTATRLPSRRPSPTTRRATSRSCWLFRRTTSTATTFAFGDCSCRRPRAARITRRSRRAVPPAARPAAPTRRRRTIRSPAPSSIPRSAGGSVPSTCTGSRWSTMRPCSRRRPRRPTGI